MTLSLPPLSDPGQKFPLLWIERVVFRDPAATSVITRRYAADAGGKPTAMPAESLHVSILPNLPALRAQNAQLGQAFTLLLPQLAPTLGAKLTADPAYPLLRIAVLDVQTKLDLSGSLSVTVVRQKLAGDGKTRVDKPGDKGTQINGLPGMAQLALADKDIATAAGLIAQGLGAELLKLHGAS